MIKIQDCGVMPMFFDTREFADDGSPIIVDNYHVWATLADGRRFEHNVRFVGGVEHDEEGYGYSRGFNGDEAKAQALAARVRVAGVINEDHWVEIDAAYGSEAWQAQDAGGFFAWREKQEDMEAGR